jgi:GTP-binding protein Era
VHTTTKFSKAVTNRNNSQIIVFDTPGLVTKQEIKKHKLNDEFISSCRHSIQHSSLIGVLHDVSNHWNRNCLHPIILDLLKEFDKRESFLILNKIDKLRSKRVLLELIKTLTCNNLTSNQRKGRSVEMIEKEHEKPVGWPYFSNVFLVSSLTGDGVERVIEYIETKSQSQSWEYKNNEFCDKKPEELIEEFVRARLLDYLPQEIPYLLTSQLEFFSQDNNKIYASVNVTCPNERIEKLLCGVSNGKLKQITERVTSDLIEAFKVPISLTIATVCLKKKE